MKKLISHDLEEFLEIMKINSNNYTEIVGVRLTQEQYELLSKYSIRNYGKINNSGLIREVLEKHFFKSNETNIYDKNQVETLKFSDLSSLQNYIEKKQLDPKKYVLRLLVFHNKEE